MNLSQDQGQHQPRTTSINADARCWAFPSSARPESDDRQADDGICPRPANFRLRRGQDLTIGCLRPSGPWRRGEEPERDVPLQRGGI